MGLAAIPLKILLISIDLLITLVTFGWVKALLKRLDSGKVLSVPVGDDESHRVQTGYKGNLLKTPANGAKTLFESSQMSFQENGASQCMGTRRFLGWKEPKKVKHFGDVSWRSYAEVEISANRFGAALAAAGVKPAPVTTTLEKNDKINCRVAIFENTCAEWMIACLGSFTQSVTVVTVYATLGIEAVAEAVDDNIVSVIVCNRTNVSKLLQMKSNMPTLTHIVYTNDIVSPDDLDKPTEASKDGVTVISFDDFLASGDVNKHPAIPPTPESTAVIMYTSGSTGKPKGVVITHASCTAAVAGLIVAGGLQKGSGDQYVGYLPLAHIMELVTEFVFIHQGYSIGYADPKTLSAKGAYPTGALEVFRPSLFVAVPKIWDTIKKGVLAKVALSPPVAQLLVHTAIEWRTFAMKLGLDTPFFNKLVFKKLSAGVGGNLRIAASGGGPLNGEVQQFCRTCFCPNFVQGYGLTETCASLSMQDFDDLRPGVAGYPTASCEVKLDSTPEIGDKAGQLYLSTDRFDVEGNKVFGRGEILVRGNHVSSGYYMNETATKEVFCDDGWFRTGDIGQFLSDGSLRIVDRKKNLVKLKGGEYVALEQMEMTYGNSAYVDAVNGGICCYGDGDMDRPVALMQLNEIVTMGWAKENGVEGDYESVKKNEQLMATVLADMKNEHAKSNLSHLEKLVGVVFVDETWTPENGCLTAANKLQRRMVVQQCEKEFNAVKPIGIF